MRFYFPADFLWGAAASAHQIERAASEDGKGENKNDYYARLMPDKHKGYPENTADFYHHYREDIAMMKELGLKSFRFSISWARIYPDGPEKINQKGIDYYNDVIDNLVANDILPFFDLVHEDFPMWIYHKGGLVNREFIDWFTLYARTCFEAFGDRVKLWVTINEPSCVVYGAYARAATGPFISDMHQAMMACRNMLIAHFRTVKLYHSMNLGGRIGAVNDFYPAYSLSFDAKDIAAAERLPAFYTGWWLDPMMLGHCPECLMNYEYITDKLPEGYEQEITKNFERMDFMGINYYSVSHVRFKEDGMLDAEGFSNPVLTRDDYGFAFYPQGLFDAMIYLKERYGDADIYITENGTAKARDQAYLKRPSTTHDDYRIKSMREHIRMISRSIIAGAKVRGFYSWSFMDTYEAFNVDFGLVAVNYETLDRTPRESYYYYKKIIENNTVD
jgi:beta-glucosidase